MRRRAGLWLARVAAPAALLLAATVAILLVRDGLHADDEPEPPAAVRTTTAATTTTTRTAATTTRPQPAARYHVIEPGDTLLVISERFDTTVTALLRLNPGVDPTNLVVGRRIRVA